MQPKVAAMVERAGHRSIVDVLKLRKVGDVATQDFGGRETRRGLDAGTRCVVLECICRVRASALTLSQLKSCYRPLERINGSGTAARVTG